MASVLAPSGLAGSVAVGDARGKYGEVGMPRPVGPYVGDFHGHSAGASLMVSTVHRRALLWVLCLHPWSLLVLLRLWCDVWLVTLQGLGVALLSPGEVVLVGCQALPCGPTGSSPSSP